MLYLQQHLQSKISSVRYKQRKVREDIQHNAVKLLRDVIVNHAQNETAMKLMKTVKSFREKKLVISKADKSNNVVVMDEQYYERVVMKTISDGPYVELDCDPLKNIGRRSWWGVRETQIHNI